MGFSFDEVEEAFAAGKTSWKKFMNEKLPTIVEYNKIDVLSLVSLTQKYFNAISPLAKQVDPKDDLFKHMTVGQHTYSLCKRSWKTKGYKVAPADDEEKDKFIRKSLTAGRTEVFCANTREPVVFENKPLAMVDVVSLYPYAMSRAENFYPCGESSWVQQRDVSKLGFYEVRVQQKEGVMNVLPFRDFEHPEIPLDWKFKGEYITFCSSIDVDVLQRAGHYVEVVRGLEFSDKLSGSQLFQFLDVFAKVKNE